MRAAQTGNVTSFEVGTGSVLATPLQQEIVETLERLSRLLVPHVAAGDGGKEAARTSCGDAGTIKEAVRFLGQVASCWSLVAEDALPEHGAGFGSTVEVEDAAGGPREWYPLMTGALLDIDAGQVSLASPIGQALLGAVPGMMVSVTTPMRRRTLRVVSVRTLQDRLQQEFAAL